MNEIEPSFLGKERDSVLRFIRECVSSRPEQGERASDTQMTELLDQYLGAAVVTGSAAVAGPAHLVKHVYPGIDAPAVRSVRDCLLAANTPLPVLQEIKEYHQRIAGTSGSHAERRVATAVYFAAIASALVFQQQRMTSYSDGALREALSKLLAKSWLAPELKALLEKATAVLPA
jgi:hypothetical protein